MADTAIKFETIEDGGNPRKQSQIHQIEQNAFSITPFIEDNDPNYKFRFEIHAINKTCRSQKIFLRINWNEPLYNEYRTTIYCTRNGSRKWEPVLMTNGGSSTSAELMLQPGVSKIALQPSYSYGDVTQFIQGILSSEKIFHECIGRTAQNRKIHQITLNSAPEKKKKGSILIVCRIHPYETAGSYCAEGIIETFLRGSIKSMGNLCKYRVHVIPMANPDGVYNGLCKRTADDGVDLSKHLDAKDLTCSALIDFIDRVRPAIYCEIHNWMLPNVDGIYFLNRWQAHRLTRRFPRDVFRNWKIEFNKRIFAGKPVGLKKYCRNKFNSKAFVLEFPWLGRSTTVMKAIGVLSLKAISYL